MNKVKCVIPVLLLLLMYGCYPTTHTTQSRAFPPNARMEIQLRMDISDFVVIGETEINVSYLKYFGAISVMKTVNGVKYNPSHKYYTNIGDLPLSGNLNKAAMKILEEYPEAAYYYVVFKQKTVEPILLFGKEIKETALVRVYDYKKNLKDNN